MTLGAVRRFDEARRIRSIHQPLLRWHPPSVGIKEPSLTPRRIADAFVQSCFEDLALESDAAMALDTLAASTPTEDGKQLRFDHEMRVAGQATVSYVQTVFGLPVFGAGIGVRMRGPELSVTGLQNSVHYDLTPPRNVVGDYSPDSLDAQKLLDASLLSMKDGVLEILAKRPLVHRYDPNLMGNGVADPERRDTQMRAEGIPVVEVARVQSLQPGSHYVVTEVMFDWAPSGWYRLHWRALVEVVTGAVLRLDVATACIGGHVYRCDPPTAVGDTSIQPTSPAPQLDGLREHVNLIGLVSASPQDLRGVFVHVKKVGPPRVTPPTVTPPNEFSFSVPTDDFAAVNAYFHCDRAFRMVSEMGFDVSQYFDGTKFPVAVDHRATIGGSSETANAQAQGNGLRTGTEAFLFARVDDGAPVGMATHWRVVLHEFGHALLWDHLRSPNFPFAHSPGDALAAILNDPDSRAPDKGLTFPWTPIVRRHDRTPAAGWAWGGQFDSTTPVGNSGKDRAGYDREQILSSTLFRFYRSVGGGHADVAVRTMASRYVTYLILSGIASMSHTAPPEGPGDFADLLIEADLGTDVFEGMPGGVTHKVIRWAFEQQGLYQLTGVPFPVVSAGAPPDVDVYLDDGRAGHYDERTEFQRTASDVWNRTHPDDVEEHEEASAEATNYLYVRVRNRGVAHASSVRARIFRSIGVGDLWPDAWRSEGLVLLDGELPPREERTLGPLEWRPEVGQAPTGFLVAIEADGDASNLDIIGGPVSTSLLAHCDNNVAIRWVKTLAL